MKQLSWKSLSICPLALRLVEHKTAVITIITSKNYKRTAGQLNKHYRLQITETLRTAGNMVCTM
jgi:hypothetical protein